VVGDVIPVIAAWLSQRPVATYLVAYSSHYEGTLRLPWPCAALLKSRRFKAVYSRDQRTAEDLSRQLQRPVTFLGNPFMDSVLTAATPPPSSTPRIGLLPGSRRPELEQNLQLLLRLIELLPNTVRCNVDLALVPSLDDDSLRRLSERCGWHLKNGVLEREGARGINVCRGAFRAVLQQSDLVIGMAGTAIEQAVGLAKPVLQVPGQGPQFTAAFAEAQRRLLGPTVFCADGESGSREALEGTAELAMALLDRARRDPDLQQQCKKEAKWRLGDAGGGPRMAAAICSLLA